LPSFGFSVELGFVGRSDIEGGSLLGAVEPVLLNDLITSERLDT